MADGREEQQRLLNSLRRSRAAAFRSEVFPYFRYVAQSGFGLLLSAIVFTLIIAYANLLREVPADVPADIAGAAAIAAAAVWRPMRTYAQQADPIFLLPMESSVLRAYFRPAIIRSVWFGIVRCATVYAVFIPLYVKAPVTEAAASGRSLWLLGIGFAALGAWNAYCGWRERQAVYVGPRLLLRAARYAATLLSAWALLNASPLPAWGLAVGTTTIVALLWRLPCKQTLPWERLIREEDATRRRWFRFLGWFVDVPSQDAKPFRRRWAAWIGDLLPWDRRKAWHYWQTKTFLRGETFGALSRWYAVIGLVVVAADAAVADWIAYGIGIVVGGFQLTELARFRPAFPVDTLPADPGSRRSAAAAIARAAGAAGTVLLWLLTAFTEGWMVTGLAWGMLAAALLWSIWIIPRRVAKQGDEEDD